MWPCVCVREIICLPDSPSASAPIYPVDILSVSLLLSSPSLGKRQTKCALSLFVSLHELLCRCLHVWFWFCCCLSLLVSHPSFTFAFWPLALMQLYWRLSCVSFSFRHLHWHRLVRQKRHSEDCDVRNESRQRERLWSCVRLNVWVCWPQWISVVHKWYY